MTAGPHIRFRGKGVMMPKVPKPRAPLTPGTILQMMAVIMLHVYLANRKLMRRLLQRLFPPGGGGALRRQTMAFGKALMEHLPDFCMKDV